MPVTVHEICGSAEAFRRCYPHWPSAEPQPAAPDPVTVLRARTARIRSILSGQTVPPLPHAPQIELGEPGTDPETERLYRLERADYTEG